MSNYAVSADTLDEAPAFARLMAEVIASGREFAVWVESDAGDERLAYTVRKDAGVYRVRDADLNDTGAFADIGAAMRHAQQLVDVRL